MASVEETLARLAQEKEQKRAATASPSAITRRGDTFKTAFAGSFDDLPKKQPAKPGGWKGFVGDVLGGPVGTVLKGAGEALSLPGRAVTSGLREFIDAVDSDPNTTASWDDFKTQVKDPTFGFGRIAKDVTGNKWLDRAIGFVGDVALDPLTYVTLGTSKFAGQSGRFALAKVASEAGVDAAKVAKVARYGRSALDAEDIARLGVNKTGLYMFGKRIKGTGKVGEVTEEALANMRVFTSDTRMGRAFQKAFTPKDYKELRLALARGEVLPERAKSALVVINSRATERQAGARALGEANRIVSEAVADKAEVESVRKILYKTLENPDLLAAASPVVQAAHAKWRKIYDDFYDGVDNAMKELGGENPFGFRENYVPRIETPAARDWRIRENNNYSRQMNTYIDNPNAPAGVFNPRKLKEGSEWFGYTLKKEDLSIDRLNELARAGGFKGDYFETDIVTITQKYVSDWAEQMGLVARLKELNDTGVMRDWSLRHITSVSVDEAAVKAQKEILSNADEALKKSTLEFKDSLQQAIEGAVVVRSNTQTLLDQASTAATSAARQAADDAEVLQRASAGVAAVEQQIDNFSKTIASLVAADGSMPIAAGPMVRRIEDLKQQLVGLRDELARMVEEEEVLKTQLATAKGADRAAAESARKAARTNRQKVLSEQMDRFDDGVQAINDTLNYNMLIGENYDAVRAGVKFEGESGRVLNDVATWIGSQPLSAQKRGRGGVRPAIGGSVASYVKQRVSQSDWFNRVTRRAKIAPTKVANVTDDSLRGSVGGLLDDPVTYLESGRASGVWAVARDEKIFNADLPVVLQSARDDLLNTLDAADEAAAKIGAGAGTSRGDDAAVVFHSELSAATDEAEDLARQLKNFTDIADTINARGLSGSDIPLTAQDKQLIADALSSQAKDSTVASGRSVSDDVADIFDEYTPGLAESDLAGMSAEASAKAQQSATNASFMSKAVSEAIQGQPKTYKELYDTLKRLENAVLTRQWDVGSGATARKFTVRDAVVRMDAQDGMSVMRRSLKNAEESAAVRDALSKGATPEQAALDVAEKVSMYYVLSEVNQRFLGLTSNLAPVGGVVTKDMLKDMAENVTRPFIQMWEAKVKKLVAANAPEAEQAQRVLASLKSFSDNPSEEYFSMLLGDAGTRMANSAPTAAVAGRSGLTVKARQVMDSAVDQLQSKKAEPLYLKSLSDKELVDALDELAGYDLYNHVLPDGTRGFLVRGEDGSMDLLTLPDGRPLSFEQAEWESLFVKRGTTNAEDGRRLLGKEMEIDKIGTRLERARALQAQIERKRLNGTATLDDMKDLNALPLAIRKMQDDIGRLQGEASQLRAVAAANDPAVRAAALEKVRILVQGNGTQSGWFSKGVDVGDILHPNAAAIAERRTNLMDAWKATPEGKVQAEVQELSARASATAAEGFVNTPEAVARQSARVIDAADEAGRKAAAQSVDAAATTAEENVSVAARISNKLKETSAARRAQSAEVKKIENEISKLQRAMDSARDRAVAGAQRKLGEAEGALPGLQETLTRAQLAFNQSEALRMSTQEYADQVVPGLEATIKFVDDVIAGTVDMPQTRIGGRFGPKPKQYAAPSSVVDKSGKRAAARERLAAEGKTMKPKISPDEAADLLRWARSARRALDMFGANPDDPLAKVLLAASEAESRFLMTQVTANQERNVLRMLKEGDTVATITRAVDEGFDSLERIGLPRKQMPKELADVMTNVRQMKQPEVARFLNRFIGKYTSFFKAYATLSPGFHVRNAIGNTIMIFAAGANPGNMARGLGHYRSLMDAVKRGVPVETWLDDVAKRVSEEEFKHIDIAVRAMEASGGGRVQEAFANLTRSGSRVYDNPLTRGSQRVGGRVEGSGHFILGYDSAAKGLDFYGASARGRRYLVDYLDVGTADENMRQIVPFWMWMSRNLPLQVVNQWTEPRTYAIYGQFMKNFGEDDSQDVVPKWLKQQGAIKIADNWYLSVDTGFNRLGETLEMAATPTRLLSQVNPILRAPLEVSLLDKKLYRGTPFSERAQEFAGGPLSPAVALLSTLLDQNRPLPGGGTGTTDKLNYALMNLIPTAAQAERLIPSSEFYKDRQLGSILSYLGAPLRQVTDNAREAELRRRQREGE